MKMKVLITGTSQGIGRAICQLFLDKGYEVIGFDKNEGNIINDNYTHYQIDIRDYDKLPEISGVNIDEHIVNVVNTNAEGFANEVLKLKNEIGGSILITDSRRTGEQAREKIMSMLKDIPAYTYLFGEEKENPYMGYLACADNIIVSGDSVSMTCDACGTGKPVYIYTGFEWLTPKQMRFVQSLYDNGYAVPCISPKKLDFEGGKCLNVAEDVANKIKELCK